MRFLARTVTILLLLVAFISGFFLLPKGDNSTSENEDLTRSNTSKETVSSIGMFAEFSDRINDVSNSANPSILWIESNDNEDSFGTGFVFTHNDKQYILTNYHVVAQSESIIGYTLDDSTIDLSIVGYDKVLDLAVLKFDKTLNIPSLELASSDKVQVGDFVLAIGHPLGLDYTTTLGIVSATDRELELGNNNFTGLIQTDAAINPGNSGGPLFNMEGQVIGINTAIMEDSQGLGFVVAMSDILPVIPKLIEEGTLGRPYIGVVVTDSREGVYIVETMENSPASNVGLMADDIIITLNKKTVENVDDFTSGIDNQTVGSNLQITVMRNGERLSKELVLGDRNQLSDEF